MTKQQSVQIAPPNIQTACFTIEGLTPLVIHRFSQKAKNMMLDKMRKGSTAKNVKKREPLDEEATFNASRYIGEAKHGRQGEVWRGLERTGTSKLGNAGHKKRLLTEPLFILCAAICIYFTVDNKTTSP